MTEQPTLFVTDPTAEVARISAALQAQGYSVVDLPLSLLVSRVSSQLPALIFVDADADGALEVVQQVRGLPGGEQIEVIFFGEQGKTLVDTTDAVLAGASGFLARPLDISVVVRKVQALVPLDALTEGPVASSGHRSQRIPKSLPPPSLPSSRRPIAAIDGASWGVGDAAIAVPRLSEELEGILRSAEARVGEILPHRSDPPSPEDEVDAVLPRPLLEALEEPLNEDEFGSWGNSTPANTRNTAAFVEPAPPSVPVDSLFPLPAAAPAVAPAPALEPPVPVSGVPLSGAPLEASTRIERATVRLASEPPAFHPPSPALSPPIPSLPPPSLEPPPSEPFPEPPATVGHRAPTAPPPAPRTVPPSAPGESSPSPPPTPRPFTPLPPVSPGVVPVEPPPAVAPAQLPAHPELPASVVLGEGDSLKLLAKAIAERFSGVLCFDGQGGLRRVVLRDGDVMTASSSIEEESLVAFLVQRGDLPHDLGHKLQGRLPPFGRHAGAALVAHGHLSQDRLWEALRGHAEWLVGKVLSLQEGICQYEAEAAGRLRSEPAVFGGSTGAEVLVEIGRRVLPAAEANRGLGGGKARLGEGKRFLLLNECALEPGEADLIERCRGFTVSEVLEAKPSSGLASVLLVLVRLGVLETLAPSEIESVPPPPRDELDDEALRARVRARLALVEEGDYFAVLGVPRGATPYEIRRAYLELRRSLEPSRVLSPTTADLADAVRTIVEILDEAFEVLRDTVRRERYRRAIEARPPED